MTIEETVRWFNSLYEINKQESDSKSNFCCGITNDLESKKNELKIEHFIGVTKCDSSETAKNLAEKMQTESYTMADGNTTGLKEDFIYVYLFRRIG